MIKSPLQKARSKYIPKLPKSLEENVALITGEASEAIADKAAIKQMFPNTYGLPLVTFEAGDISENQILNVGVVLSGGQAPGGHNVISGLFDRLKKLNNRNQLFGFIGGPDGLLNNSFIDLHSEIVSEYRNTGGFDIIGSGRTKIEDEASYDKVIANCLKNNINALVIVGGDDSNTNACVLAEYFQEKKAGIQVIGCPKTIDGDLKNSFIETSFGFDTACKVYSELIGNIQRDANSAKKYWHFIKLMGRSASHISLECALKTQPNIAIISEEIEKYKLTLNKIVGQIAEVVKKRANKGENFGTVLIPEGLVEFMPSIKKLISELNDILASKPEYNKLPTSQEKRDFITGLLSEESAKVYSSLPDSFAKQLTLDRDPHGNVQVSKIETEKLLIDMVTDRLDKDQSFHGKFNAQNHFFGYEGRCAAPSNFDADYCYSLGCTAALLINSGKTGYMAFIKNTSGNSDKWLAGGVPITMMMNMERRNGHEKPVIQKALVDLKGNPFLMFRSKRKEWATNSDYIYPGPIQYFGPSEVCDAPSETLLLEQESSFQDELVTV
ncbi:diphosphate--fructose-6-phosphate 1-phosphotransferase [Ancylomarina euxinus]|uniref:Pyrophosphate--fructose 6-phosphate 1-phosphotransferase n=1 Tax=Ancylomarina euxinus TaxID=2283627 RepID=A0A425Y874_9BACT|nr:diphosphate--fructose-6-phosphate 1-phosphotransferase [Ancylomarina euxinus]MCZ4693528.1 diphosphate--fructose-6-phosphate 1-phosphotransferase [Ancylomarina euxinus]MUP13755.1 diphosphate--fructose-6-phosphate 1-phosphotransferase [Ancylomarina euxinus]RRG24607.1 diphosphate--fructose-6-phosphate 1-phosphotransferase [Ancylomarina euxinus]